jgi:hypothetical protein
LLIQSKPAEREAILHAMQRVLAAQPRVVFAYVYGSFLGECFVTGNSVKG